MVKVKSKAGLITTNSVAVFLIFCSTLFTSCIAQKPTVSEATKKSIQDYKNNHTLTYERTIEAYKKLADKYESAKLMPIGKADCGKQMYLFIIDQDKEFKPSSAESKAVLMINNGIHPGEPCGIDASVNFANNLLKDAEFQTKTKNLVIGIVPIYNVGGSLNRGCCSRANQNGPEEYGFRGNAKNLDLNRDFVKMDSKNAHHFATMFHFLDPDVLVDTHTSNGADYQYTMTLLTTQLDKLNPQLSSMVKTEMLPDLYSEMNKKDYPMVPYVNSIKSIPDHGIYDYLESPRYCTGYATLFNTIGFTTETHMWKPFSDRVQSTYEFLNIISEYTNANYADIQLARRKAFAYDAEISEFALNWKLDTSKYDIINFKGYEAEYYTSEITGLETYKYNRDKPWEKEIKYFNRYSAEDIVNKPKFYVIPQSWTEVIDRLAINNIEHQLIQEDTSMIVSSYYIEDHQTGNRPYEGHYLHKNIKVRSEEQMISFFKGDLLIPTGQKNIRFVIEMLEPQAADSYFAWNFFDEILQQKEYFSHYIFEEKAKEMLENDPEMAAEFKEKQKSDPEFSKSHWGQLYWIYKRSENYEPSHLRYPVFRIN